MPTISFSIWIFAYILSITAFAWQWQIWVAVIQTVWPAKQNIYWLALYWKSVPSCQVFLCGKKRVGYEVKKRCNIFWSLVPVMMQSSCWISNLYKIPLYHLTLILKARSVGLKWEKGNDKKKKCLYFLSKWVMSLYLIFWLLFNELRCPW